MADFDKSWTRYSSVLSWVMPRVMASGTRAVHSAVTKMPVFALELLLVSLTDMHVSVDAAMSFDMMYDPMLNGHLQEFIKLACFLEISTLNMLYSALKAA